MQTFLCDYALGVQYEGAYEGALTVHWRCGGRRGSQDPPPYRPGTPPLSAYALPAPCPVLTQLAAY
eukprot:1042389-Rhodomonas_salina.1